MKKYNYGKNSKDKNNKYFHTNKRFDIKNVPDILSNTLKQNIINKSFIIILSLIVILAFVVVIIV